MDQFRRKKAKDLEFNVVFVAIGYLDLVIYYAELIVGLRNEVVRFGYE